MTKTVEQCREFLQLMLHNMLTVNTSDEVLDHAHMIEDFLKEDGDAKEDTAPKGRKPLSFSATLKDKERIFTALCDDGSMWIRENGSGWMKMHPIPQD